MRPSLRAAPAAYCLLLLASAACGGDEPEIDCSTFSACGGDPVGEWSYRELCVQVVGAEPTENSCSQVFPDWSGVRTSGTLKLDGDGSYVRRTALTGDITASWPATCEMTVSCEELSNPEEDITCSIQGPDCFCRWPGGTGQIFEETGTWEASGDTIGFEPDEFGTPYAPSYCVQGDVLVVKFDRSEPGELTFAYGLARQ